MREPNSPPPAPPDTVEVASSLASLLQSTLQSTVLPVTRQTSPLTQQIYAAVAQMHTVSNGGEYAAALNNLRQSVTTAAPLVNTLYSAAPQTDYIARWSLVKVLADMNHSATLNYLNAIVNTPLPAVQTEAMQEMSKVEETMIRTMAVEGIAQQARAGNGEAVALLLQNCRNPLFSVKQASVQAYIASGGPQARTTLTNLLPAGEHFILDIRPVSAAQLSQSHGAAAAPPAAARETAAPPPFGVTAPLPPVGDTPPHAAKS